MKKAIMASIIALSAIGLVGCDRVEPGNVGIKVNKLGYDKGVGEVVGVGRYWTGWNTEVYIFPTFKQMKTYDDAFNFQMSDGTTIGYHIGGQADAKLKLAEAEAKSIQIRGQAMRENPEVLQLEAINKWNGTLPQYMTSGANTPFIQVK